MKDFIKAMLAMGALLAMAGLTAGSAEASILAPGYDAFKEERESASRYLEIRKAEAEIRLLESQAFALSRSQSSGVDIYKDLSKAHPDVKVKRQHNHDSN